MIKKVGEITENKKQVIVVIGPPGVGKTTLALSSLNPVLIDSDGKSDKTEIEHQIHVPIIEFQDINELKRDVQSDTVKNSDTIVIDTAGTLISYFAIYVIQKNSKNAQKDGMTLNQKGWGAVKIEFINLIDYFRLQLNKHVVIICHAKETVKKIDGEEVYWYKMDVPGGSSVFIEQKADLLCVMEMYNNQRTLGFSPTSHYYAKSAYGIKGIKNIPELKPGHVNNYLEKLFSDINEYRKKSGEKAKKIIQEEYEPVMKKVREIISGVKDIETANKAKKSFKSMDFPFSSKQEAWILLKQKAESVGLKYDTKVFSFVFDENKNEKSIQMSDPDKSLIK